MTSFAQSDHHSVRTTGSVALLSILAWSSLILPGTSAAQSGNAPAYISSMSPFEVKALTGELAPTNGTSTIASVTPDEWKNNDPGYTGLVSVIIAWNGGAKGIGSKLIVHGGGHNDSANNGIYIFDYAGTDRPTGWQTPLVISSVNAVRANGATYSDGLPTAVHTYDGAVYANHNNHVYRFGGSQYNNGFMTEAAFKFDMATKSWSRLPNYPGQGGGAKTLYDAATGKIFVTMNDSLTGYFFRTDNDTWSSGKDYGGDGFPYDSGGAWDPTRNRGIIVGDGEKSLISLDFSKETVSVEGFSASGSTAILGQNGLSAVYDPYRDVYWLFGGKTNSTGWTTLYEMNADGPPWTITAHVLSGDAIQRSQGMWGSWGRYVLMAQWRAIGLIASDESPAYVLKLPGAQPPSPTPPNNLSVD